MRKFLVVIFILAFQVEVRVRASGTRGEGYKKNQDFVCDHQTQDTCALFANQTGIVINQENLKIQSSAETSIIKMGAHSWRFLKGTLWIKEAKNVEIETVYGTATAGRGEYWLIQQGEKLLVRNIGAQLQILLRDGRRLEVPEGFEFWIAGLNSSGKSEFGMIQPVNIKEHLKLWHSLYKGDSDSFRGEVSELRERWRSLPELSGTIYQALAKGEVERRENQKLKHAEKLRHQKEISGKIKETIYQRAFQR